MSNQLAFDYVVVGGGSAGCVVAARLSEDPAVQVVLIEAGPKPRSPWISIPAGMSRLIFPGPYNWGYSTSPEPNLAGRQIYLPRGRGLGGSSLINGMGFVRGNPADFDEWERLGNTGWGWHGVMPYFRKLERFHGDTDAEVLRGRSGPVDVCPPRYIHPATRDFITAATAVGHRLNPDINGSAQVGAGLLQFNMIDGQRASTERAYLAPVRRRRNLTVLTDALVHRVEIESGRAQGVVFEQKTVLRKVTARREVILSAGAIASPKLLMLSGIGPGAALREHGLPVFADLPGVGKNLQDHLYIHHTSRVSSRSSANAQLRGVAAFRHGLQYVFSRNGLLTMGASQACIFASMSGDADAPDLQINFRPVSWEFSPTGTLKIGRTPEITASSCHLHPRSRGAVSLSSGDPREAPLIAANYLDSSIDCDAAVAGIHLIRAVMRAEPMTSRMVSEVAPGAHVSSDDEILGYAREHAQSMHHWVGTCRMGVDRHAVVDPALRVHGVEGLRVIDASIMPSITSGNTNAPSIMIGEKGADLLRQGA